MSQFEVYGTKISVLGRAQPKNTSDKKMIQRKIP